MAEGVLKRDGGGNRSGPARFILLPLDSEEKGAASAHPYGDDADAAETSSEGQGMGALSTHPKAEVKECGQSAP